MKDILKPLAKSVLILLELTAAVSATDVAIHKKMFVSFRLSKVKTALIISNEKMNDIMKILKSLQESGLLTKGVSERIKNEAKNKKQEFMECY